MEPAFASSAAGERSQCVISTGIGAGEVSRIAVSGMASSVAPASCGLDQYLVDPFAGHADLDNVGYAGTPINERRYPNAHLATALSKAEAMG
jgi:hypothetical protein